MVKKATKKATTTKKVKSTKPKKVVKAKVGKVDKSKLVNAPEDKCFFLVNGQKLKNYEELAKILGRIEENVFRHHVNESRNDFVNWVKDVFNDVELAKKIAGIHDKDKLQLVIYRHIMRH